MSRPQLPGGRPRHEDRGTAGGDRFDRTTDEMHPRVINPHHGRDELAGQPAKDSLIRPGDRSPAQSSDRSPREQVRGEEAAYRVAR